MLGNSLSGAIAMPATFYRRASGGGDAYGPQSIEYDTAGSYTFTVPAGASAIDVVVIGGGGSGGAHTNGTSGGPAGNAGGTSSFGSFCSATGGSGGSGSQSPRSPILGGIGSGGDTNMRGGQGGTGDINRGHLGGAGGAGQGGAPGGGGSGNGGGGKVRFPGGAGGDYGGAGGTGQRGADADSGKPPGGGGGGQIWGTGGGGGGVAIKRVSGSPGDAIPVRVGAGGAAVTGSYPYASGAGADGAVRLSWVGAPYAGRTAPPVLETATLRVPRTLHLPGGGTHSRGALGDTLRFPVGTRYIGTAEFSVMCVFTAKSSGFGSGTRGIFGEVYGYWGVRLAGSGTLTLFTYTGKYDNIQHTIRMDKKYAAIMTVGASELGGYVSEMPDRTLPSSVPQKYDAVGAFDIGATDMAYGVSQFNGDVHDVATWDRVLTDEEIKELKGALEGIHGTRWS